MKTYFVDAVHFIALANPSDQWHTSAVSAAAATNSAKLVTTEDVLIEFLNFYAERGSFMRKKVSEITLSVLLDPRIDIVHRDDLAFLNALELYEQRLDKGYSLTDCISMNVCRKENIEQVLTSDRHFEQEGFEILLKSSP